MAGGSLIDRVLDATPKPVEGTLRTAGAIAGDIAGALDPFDVIGNDVPEDPFDARDPEHIRRTLPALRAMNELYFRAEVEGLDRIPARGPVLLVGNHSGGTLIADSFVFAEAFYAHFGPDRLFHQLAHDMVFQVPGARAMVSRYGTVPASPENMQRSLREGGALLVYPGGDHESFRPSWESGKVDFAERTGFVKLALELEVPIVPVVAIGGQETAFFLGQGRGLAKRLGLDSSLRLKVLPAQIAPPWGLTFLDLPIRLPLPSKIKVSVLDPIDLQEELGPSPDPDEGYEFVTAAMQSELDGLSADRRVPVVG